MIIQSSPHTHRQFSTWQLMRLVLFAMLPGVAVQTVLFGWGVPLNLIWCSLIALGSESLVLLIRKRPVATALQDGTALITAWLLALAVPPLAPWWLTLVGVSFAIVIGKQLYGGLGNNPFNPAMVGYVLLLTSFPLEMTRWLTPATLGGASVGLGETLGTLFPLLGHGADLDAVTMATPLEIVRENNTLTLAELQDEQPALRYLYGHAWFWINLAYLAGGLFLLYMKVYSWHAPVAMLTALLSMSVLFQNGTGSASHGSVLFHLFSGATMLGAFFIVTDPVSGATSNQGRLIFGAGVGVLVYVIRAWGGYPDAVAFATLLINMTAPLIDYYTHPRSYGHQQGSSGLTKRINNS